MNSPIRLVIVSQVARLGVIITDFFARVLRNVIWPKAELLARLWLAKPLFMSSHEAAHVGGSIEILGAALLALGLMTRYAAVALLGLTAMLPPLHGHIDQPLLWAALLGWFAIHGAGPIAFDTVLRRGLATSALPGASRLLRASEKLRSLGTTWYLSVLRVWLALALLAGSLTGGLRAWLPLDAAHFFPSFGASVAGGLLLAGLGTRYVAGALLVILSADAMMTMRIADTMYLAVLLTILLVYGAGVVSVDALLTQFSVVAARVLSMRDTQGLADLPRVVIIGAGFGGISCAAHLRKARVSVTLIDRENYHLFQPLLYQVATAALSPGDIATPVRQLFRDAPRIRVLRGNVTGVDTNRKCVNVAGGELPYDYLVVATGATHSYFGNDHWATHAPGLKGIGDALEIRRRILTAFEQAEATTDADERTALTTFLIVGGGPTGVELAGAIAELARFGMAKEFRTFDPAESRVVLVQSAARLLPAFPESLGSIAQDSLAKLGIEVLLGRRVDGIDAEGALIGSTRIVARTVLWAAGVAASPAAAWLRVGADAAGRIKVQPDMSVDGMPDVFAIGDTAASTAWDGKPVPGIAPAAKQEGAYVARVISARIDGRSPPRSFKYRHFGNLATIGRKAAVVDFGYVRLWGATAWWVWGIVHVGFLVGLRNRVATMTNWFWAYLTFGRGIRLITGNDGEPPTPQPSTSRPSTMIKRQ